MIKLLSDKISVFTGCDDLLFPSFALGSPGAIVAVANIAPKLTVEIYNLIKKGDIRGARKTFFRIIPIAQAISVESNFPAQVKEAINLLNRPAGPTRIPIPPLSIEEKKPLRNPVVK